MVLMKRQQGLPVRVTAATEGEPCGVLWVKIGITTPLSPAKMAIVADKPCSCLK